MSSIEGRLPSKVVFRQRSSSIKGRLQLKGVFRQASHKLPPSYPRSEPSNYKLGRLERDKLVGDTHTDTRTKSLIEAGTLPKNEDHITYEVNLKNKETTNEDNIRCLIRK